MASDKLHLSKKWNTVFIHLAAWSILFIFPLLFIERFGNINRMHNFSLIKFYIQPICIACIFYINYLWLIDKVLFRKKTIRFILYNLLLVVMANIAIYLVHRMVIPESILHQRPTPIPPPRPGFMQWQDSITLVLVVGLSAAIKVTQKWITTEKERKQLEQERTEAELKNLKNQLNPHFLFNTLNNIYSLIDLSPEKAQQAVIELSKLMRYVLYDNTPRYVPLSKEIDFIYNYVELMRLRLASNTDLSVSLPTEKYSHIEVAPLLFIALIENAFKHGVSNTQPSFVHIDISVDDDSHRIICRIENSCFPKGSDDKSGSGIGLDNLKKRLDILYPGHYTFTTKENEYSYCSELTLSTHPVQP